MSTTVLGLLLVAAGYLAGSIPFGVLLSRWFAGVDPRTVGSGNIGATNVARAGGKKLGLAVLALDVLKAVLPILAAKQALAGREGEEVWVVSVALAAFCGHLFPVWLGFRGGKGVATGLGIFLVLSPWAALAGVVTYAVAYGATRVSSLGSLSGTAVCTLGTFVAHGWNSPRSWAGLGLAGLVVLRHRENIRRLLRGDEKRV